MATKVVKLGGSKVKEAPVQQVQPRPVEALQKPKLETAPMPDANAIFQMPQNKPLPKGVPGPQDFDWKPFPAPEWDGKTYGLWFSPWPRVKYGTLYPLDYTVDPVTGLPLKRVSSYDSRLLEGEWMFKVDRRQYLKANPTFKLPSLATEVEYFSYMIRRGPEAPLPEVVLTSWGEKGDECRAWLDPVTGKPEVLKGVPMRVYRQSPPAVKPKAEVTAPTTPTTADKKQAQNALQALAARNKKKK